VFRNGKQVWSPVFSQFFRKGKRCWLLVVNGAPLSVGFSKLDFVDAAESLPNLMKSFLLMENWVNVFHFPYKNCLPALTLSPSMFLFLSEILFIADTLRYVSMRWFYLNFRLCLL